MGHPSRAEPARIVFGMTLTADPAGSRVHLEELCDALGRALGVIVEPCALWHYRRLVDALASGDVDLAWMPPLVAMRVIGIGRAQAVALPIREGFTGYHTALFTRRGSAVRGIDDLAGARAAWVDRQSASGYQIMRAYLRVRGVDLERAFSAEQFLGAHDAVARAVLDGDADVGASYFYVDGNPSRLKVDAIRRAGWGHADVQVIAHAGPIPADIVGASARVPASVVKRVQRVLTAPLQGSLSRAVRALLGAEGFVAPRQEHLEPLARLVLGLEAEGGLGSSRPG